MKNSKTNIVFITLIFLSNILCLAQSKYKLVEDSAVASCGYYSLRNVQNKVINVPKELKDAFLCPSLLDLKYDKYITYLYYDVNNQEIKLYDIEANKIFSLLKLYKETQGVSGPVYSPDSSKMMFVVIMYNGEQYGYKSTTRIVVLDVENGQVINKQKFDRNVIFHCGSICAAIPDKDFGFKDNNTIFYSICDESWLCEQMGVKNYTESLKYIDLNKEK